MKLKLLIFAAFLMTFREMARKKARKGTPQYKRHFEAIFRENFVQGKGKNFVQG
jgi:hypothetical protein